MSENDSSIRQNLHVATLVSNNPLALVMEFRRSSVAQSTDKTSCCRVSQVTVCNKRSDSSADLRSRVADILPQKKRAEQKVKEERERRNWLQRWRIKSCLQLEETLSRTSERRGEEEEEETTTNDQEPHEKMSGVIEPNRTSGQILAAVIRWQLHTTGLRCSVCHRTRVVRFSYLMGAAERARTIEHRAPIFGGSASPTNSLRIHPPLLPQMGSSTHLSPQQSPSIRRFWAPFFTRRDAFTRGTGVDPTTSRQYDMADFWDVESVVALSEYDLLHLVQK